MLPASLKAEGREHDGPSRTCLILATLPEACVIPTDEVRGVFAPDMRRDGRILSLATLGFSGQPGAPERLLVLTRAPSGPYLHFFAEVSHKEVPEGDLLPLPERPFLQSLVSALVVQEQSVLGLLIDVQRLLSRAE